MFAEEKSHKTKRCYSPPSLTSTSLNFSFNKFLEPSRSMWRSSRTRSRSNSKRPKIAQDRRRGRTDPSRWMKARGTFEKDMETLKSMSPFPSHPPPSLTLTDIPPVVELEQERRSRTEAERTRKRLEVEQDASTSSPTLRCFADRQDPRRPSTKLKKTLDNEVKQKELVKRV